MVGAGRERRPDCRRKPRHSRAIRVRENRPPLRAEIRADRHVTHRRRARRIESAARLESARKCPRWFRPIVRRRVTRRAYRFRADCRAERPGATRARRIGVPAEEPWVGLVEPCAQESVPTRAVYPISEAISMTRFATAGSAVTLVKARNVNAADGERKVR